VTHSMGSYFQRSSKNSRGDQRFLALMPLQDQRGASRNLTRQPAGGASMYSSPLSRIRFMARHDGQRDNSHNSHNSHNRRNTHNNNHPNTPNNQKTQQPKKG